MAKRPTREFTDAGVSNTRQMRDAIGDTGDFRTRLRQTASGNNLTLRTKGGEPQVFGEDDETLYLDNGFLKQGSYAPLATAEDAQHLTTSGNATTASRYLVAKALKLPFSPKAFKALFRSFSTRSSLASPAKESKLEALKAKNKAILTCPPSMFSGMMRRYVAAIYGKKVSDAFGKELSASVSGAAATLSYNKVVFNSGMPTTGIVYLASANKFWLVELGYSKLYYREMVFSEIGDDVVSKIKPTNTPEQNEILLTYALSEAQVRRNASGQVEWRDGGSFSIVGQPLNFGWRFNSSGMQATLTTFEKPNATYNNSRLYSAAIAVTEDTNYNLAHPLRFSLSVSVSKVEESLDWTTNLLRLFVPTAPGKYTWLKTGYTDANAVPASPLISFYDDNDALQVCRVSHTTGVTSPTVSKNFSGNVLTPAGTYPDNTSTSYFGWGAGYAADRATKDVGDGKVITLGGYSGTDIRLLDHFEETFAVTRLSWVPLGRIVVSSGTPQSLGYGAYGINGAENTNLSATWPLSGSVMTYAAQYTWTVNARYAGTDSTVHSILFVAPHDCCTAWFESLHKAHGASAVQSGQEPALNVENQHSFRWVQMSQDINGNYIETGPGEGTIENPLINMTISYTPAADEASGVTSCAVRNAKGRYTFTNRSNSTGAAFGPFWAATVANPDVDFDMVAQDDLKSAFTASNVIGGSDLSTDWPAQTLRSVGWQ